MIAAAGGDGEPDVGDHAGPSGVKHFVDASGRDVPRIAVAAGAIEAGLLQGSVILGPGILGQKIESGRGGTLRLRDLGCAESSGGQRPPQEGAAWFGRLSHGGIIARWRPFYIVNPPAGLRRP